MEFFLTVYYIIFYIILLFKCSLCDDYYDSMEVFQTENYQGSYGSWIKWKDMGDKCYLKIQCSAVHPNNYIMDIEEYPKFVEKRNVDLVEITNCFLSKRALENVLKSMNIETARPFKLKLNQVMPNRIPIREELYFQDLQIKELQLYTTSVPYVMFNSSYRHGNYLILQSLPTSVPKLTLSNAWVENWDNCDNLVELSVTEMTVDLMPKDWNINCPNLSTLNLIGTKDYQVQQNIATGFGRNWKHIRSLTMKNCNLHRLPIEILRETELVENLDLSSNYLDDNSLSDLSISRTKLDNLKTLDLTRNNITRFGELFNFPSLTNLTLDENQLISSPICVLTGRHCETVEHKAIKFMSLRDNPEMEVDYLFSPSEVTWENLPNMKYLDLSLSKYVLNETIELRRLTNIKKLHIEVNLTGRNFEEIIFYGYEDIQELNGTSFGLNLTIPSNGIDCDCKYYSLAQALVDYPQILSIPNLKCKSKNYIINEPLSNMNCEKVRQDDKMTIRKWNNISKIEWNSKYDVDWQEIQNAVKNLPSLESLNVTGNRIASLWDAYLPESLLNLDLSYNQISRLDSNETALLFSEPRRRVWLSGNLIICDCENTPLLDALHEHKHQVADFFNLTCIDTGDPLHLVTSFKACLLRNSLIITGALVTLMLTVILLIIRYRYHVQIYFYSRGWFLSCISEDDMDADRPYDAFLSYSHEDEEYITQHLLPKLESQPYCYRVCVHYRDWVVGDWIPAQIMRSISLSKRVIIVLSKSFVDSMWGKLEFRYAMAGLSNDGRFRLIVLVLDDVLSAELDAELQGYLALNTYMRCDDPFFWERLCYAMPHKKRFSSGKKHFPPSEKVTLENLNDIVMVT